MTDGARKTVGVMSPVGAEAGDRQAGSRAARLPTGSVLRRGARDRSPWLSLSAVARRAWQALRRRGIVNLAARGMLVVSVARRLGSEGPLLAYRAAPL